MTEEGFVDCERCGGRDIFPVHWCVDRWSNDRPAIADREPALEVALKAIGKHIALPRIRVRPATGGPWCVCNDWEAVGQMIENDGVFEFEFVKMTEAEVEALGDFPGW